MSFQLKVLLTYRLTGLSSQLKENKRKPNPFSVLQIVAMDRVHPKGFGNCQLEKRSEELHDFHGSMSFNWNGMKVQPKITDYPY